MSNLKMLSRPDLAYCVRKLPKSVADLMKANPGTLTLAGGYIRSLIAHEPVNDLDFFSPSKDSAGTAAANLDRAENPGDRNSRVRETPNAFSLQLRNGLFVQFIHRWTFQNPCDVVPSFDFTIARAAIWYDSAVWQSCCDPDYYADLAAKRLVYCQPVRNEDAGGSMLRVLKFYQRGYRIPLDSLAAVLSRLVMGVDVGSIDGLTGRLGSKEAALSYVLTGLLREVDPSVDTEAYYEPAE